MNLSAIFEIRTKKFWWMDLIFYFVVSLLVASIFCYFVFLIKNNIQSQEIKSWEKKLHEVGTDLQKEHEQEVIKYQIKVSDFSTLLENHEFASNVFAFMRTQTMPNAWFKQFNLDRKNSQVQLSGESESMDAISRQVAVFENNKYVKNIEALNTSLGTATRFNFNIGLVFDPDIFSYISNTPQILETVTPSTQ